MDSPVFKTLRICPTTQQGGTQTIQQSIYLTHNNPCGANKLIFQTMGLTQIRYIDLKNYLDEILGTEEMTTCGGWGQSTLTILLTFRKPTPTCMPYKNGLRHPSATCPFPWIIILGINFASMCMMVVEQFCMIPTTQV